MGPRIGFLGGGLIAHYHATMLAAADVDVRVAAVYDPDPRRSAALASMTSATVVDDEDALFEASDAVYVCTWTSEHPRLVRRAAAEGKHVFCEKPLAVDLAHATEMVRDVEEAGITNQVGLVLRDSPAFLLLRSLIADEQSGAVMTVVFRDDQYIPVQGMYNSTWRGDVARAGAGTLLEHSIHDLDLLEWLLGPVDAISAETRSFHGLEGIEDLAAVRLRFANGAVGTLTSVWHDVLARPSLRRVEVFCERGAYVLEGDVTGPVRWTRGNGPEEVVQGSSLFEELSRRGIEVRNPDGAWATAVIRGELAAPDFAEALRAHVLCEEAYRSAAAGAATRPVAPGRPDRD